MSCPSSSFIPIQYVNMLCNSCDFIACRSFVGVLFFSWRCGSRCFCSCCNPPQLGTGWNQLSVHCFSRPTAGHAMRNLVGFVDCFPCWPPTTAIFSAVWWHTKKLNFDRAGLAFRVDVCSHVCRIFLSHWRNHQLTKWYLLSTIAAYIGE